MSCVQRDKRQSRCHCRETSKQNTGRQIHSLFLTRLNLPPLTQHPAVRRRMLSVQHAASSAEQQHATPSSPLFHHVSEPSRHVRVASPFCVSIRCPQRVTSSLLRPHDVTLFLRARGTCGCVVQRSAIDKDSQIRVCFVRGDAGSTSATDMSMWTPLS